MNFNYKVKIGCFYTGCSKRPPSDNFLSKFFQKIFLQNNSLGVFLCKKIDCAHRKTLKTSPRPWNIKFSYFFSRNSYLKIRKLDISWTGRRFQGFSMRTIDLSHKNTPKKSFWGNFWKIFAKKWPNGDFLEHPVLVFIWLFSIIFF